MKKCIKCDISYADDKNFCKECGSPLTQEYNVDPRELAKKAVYEDRLKADPLNVEILHEYAQFLFNNLLFKNAVSTLLKILAINESDEFAKELLYGSYLKLKMYREAQELGEQLFKKNTTDIMLIEGLAEIELQKGNKVKANEYYETILKLQPENTKALYHKAVGMLENNEIENAINILKELYEKGNNDRIVTIYAGIDKSLSDNHKKAVEILEICLSDDKISLNDVNNQRGLLYLVYSLCKSQHQIDNISEWFSLLDYDLIKRFQQPGDELILAKAITEIINIYFESLEQITAEAIQRVIRICINKSIICSTEITHNFFAEIWRKIAEIQESLGLITDAQTSLKKAIELNPDNTDYEQKLNEITTAHEKRKKRHKRKVLTIVSSLVAVIVVIIISVFLINWYKENKAWESATQRNTYESYATYLRKYPENRFSKEAKKLKEDVLWLETRKANTVEGYNRYLEKYPIPNGKYIDKAIEYREEAVWANALRLNTISAYESYFTFYPVGKHVVEFKYGNTGSSVKGKWRYVGQTKDGKKEGIGIGILETNYEGMNYTYSGEWTNDIENGQGTMIWVNGDKYEGEFVGGVRNGFGKYYWPSGNYYEGGWNNNRYHGECKYYREGRWYFGTLQDGMGTLYDESGRHSRSF